MQDCPLGLFCVASLKRYLLFLHKKKDSSTCTVSKPSADLKQNSEKKKGLYLDKCSYVDHEGLCSRYNKLVHTSYGMRSANNVKNINNHNLVQNAIK